VTSLHEQRERRVVGHAVRQPRRRRVDPALLKEQVRQVLVAEAFDDLRVGQEDERAELVARLRERYLVEIGQRDDDADAVLLDERTERRDIAAVCDLRDEGVVVRPVEGGREGVDIRGDGRLAALRT
jgi:hypothetical protein